MKRPKRVSFDQYEVFLSNSRLSRWWWNEFIQIPWTEKWAERILHETTRNEIHILNNTRLECDKTRWKQAKEYENVASLVQIKQSK